MLYRSTLHKKRVLYSTLTPLAEGSVQRHRSTGRHELFRTTGQGAKIRLKHEIASQGIAYSLSGLPCRMDSFTSWQVARKNEDMACNASLEAFELAGETRHSCKVKRQGARE